MLHHVTLEVAPVHVGPFSELLLTIGFSPVDPPPDLADAYRWFERSGTQVHLALVTDPVAPAVGHAAFVVPDLDAVAERLEAAGFAVEERSRHWGARRLSVAAPAGHTLELMARPPD